MRVFLSFFAIIIAFISCQKDNTPKVAPPPKNLSTLIGYWQKEHPSSCGEEEILLFTETRIGFVHLEENTCKLTFPKIIEHTYTLTEIGKISIEGENNSWEYAFKEEQLLLKKTSTGTPHTYKRISADDYGRFKKEHQKQP